MRITLNQTELFGAITDHLRDKFKLEDTAAIEISFTAGRSPKGYTADVDITYPESDLVGKCTAKAHADESTEVVMAPNAGDAAVAEQQAAKPDPTAGGAVPDLIFQ